MLEIKRIYLPRREPVSLGSALLRFLKSNPLMLHQYTLERLTEIWSECNPSEITSATGSISLKNHILYIQIADPALRASLTPLRSNIQERLTEELGFVYLSEVKFV